MKFGDLISRLQMYLKDNPTRLNNDLTLIADDLHLKFSEYKRIKKVVFKRQVEKAYTILAKDDNFIRDIESKIENMSNNIDEDDLDVEVDSDSIDDQILDIAIKEDSGNEINNMITDLYKANNTYNQNSKEELIETFKRKSNLKTTIVDRQNLDNLDKKTNEIIISNKSPNKRVHFNDFRQEKLIDSEINSLKSTPVNDLKKRKLSDSSGNTNNDVFNDNDYSGAKNIENDSKDPNSGKISSQLSQNRKQSTKKISSSAAISKELIKSQTNFDSFACDQDIKENIFRRIYYILSPEQFLNNGKIPPRGFLLHGPPGCGKTQLVYAIAGELDLPLLKVTSTELISGVSGESEENIRGIFDKAILNAPCILFIDEIEAITQRRETASKNMEHRIVTQLLSCFDDLAVKAYVPIVVIGATNQADSLDIGLRRAGRFDQEIPIGIPDDKQRKRILEILCRKIKKNENIDLDKIVLNTPGYVGADINALIDEALISALDRRLIDQINNDNSKKDEELVFNLIDWIKHKLNRIKSIPINEIKNEESGKQPYETVEVNQNDFDIAIKRVQPSSKREGFATVPDVTWDEIGALQNVREELKTAILAPVKYASQCEIFNFTKPPGILMVGPPGCGKTLLAKAIAKESGVNFISVKGPELLNMYVGESERAVRSLFQRARNSKPCVIFFDEIDAICVKRSESSTDSGATTRVVNQMLTEMDGLESRKGVFLMAASNRPDIIDPAILRPGRLDKIIYVGLPTFEDRLEILKTITKNGTKPRISSDIKFEEIAKDERCQRYTGADLSALVREASEFALKEFIKNPAPENEMVKLNHFELAFNKIKPSVSQKVSSLLD